MTKEKAIERLRYYPYKLGHALGFTKLTELHNEWIISMVKRGEDTTLQAHRGSYKTTCVSIALAIIIICFPNDKTLFLRKTDSDVKEIIQQVRKILLSPVIRIFVLALYGVELKLTTATATEISTNLCNDPRGTSQLVAMGTSASITGKHFDRIFTDDIVNVNDRTSKAERERTKTVYQELQNIKNRDGRIFNTGTPWHENDTFSLMPEATKYDCYSTGLIDADTLADIKEHMTASLFSANYELRHIPSDKVIFTNAKTGYDASLVEQGNCHIDASYGGEDYTAFTICRRVDNSFYVLGKLYDKHIDDVEDEIIELRKRFNAGRISCENNGDKGYLAKELRAKGERTHSYHESMNKYLKITSYLKGVWNDVYFVEGTDTEYIRQITDYTEEAEHDDAPDSLACMIRELWRKQTPSNIDNNFSSYLM